LGDLKVTGDKRTYHDLFHLWGGVSGVSFCGGGVWRFDADASWRALGPSWVSTTILS